MRNDGGFSWPGYLGPKGDPPKERTKFAFKAGPGPKIFSEAPVLRGYIALCLLFFFFFFFFFFLRFLKNILCPDSTLAHYHRIEARPHTFRDEAKGVPSWHTGRAAPLSKPPEWLPNPPLPREIKPYLRLKSFSSFLFPFFFFFFFAWSAFSHSLLLFFPLPRRVRYAGRFRVGKAKEPKMRTAPPEPYEDAERCRREIELGIRRPQTAR